MNWTDIKAKGVMRGSLSIALLVSFMLALFELISAKVEEQNIQLITYMLGQLSVFTGGALAYYFATSKSSADKNDVIDDMQDRYSPDYRRLEAPTFQDPRPNPDLTGEPAGDLSGNMAETNEGFMR